MRDPFGFISYRVGPPPHVIVSTVAWSLVIIVVLTIGVQSGSRGWEALKGVLSSRNDSDPSAATNAPETSYDSETRQHSVGVNETFEATPWAPAGSESQDQPRELSVPPVEAPAHPGR